MSRAQAGISEKLLARIADALIPGDGEFPSASSVGVHRTIAIRAADAPGISFAPVLTARFGQDWQALDDETVTRRLEEIEAASPDEFSALITATYIAYYESFEVRDVIRAMGHIYNDRPQPAGYEMAAYDPANPLENPRHNRGHYLATDDVRRVDFSALGNLLERVG